MCLYPKLIPNKRYLPTKKNGGVPPVCPDERLRYVTAACGDCYECRKQKQRQWVVRMSEENRQTPNAYFLTLTIDDKSYKQISKKYKLKDNNDIATKAIRLCLERVRKITGKSVKHWFITELGHEKTERLHLHGIVWGLGNGKKITDNWKYGITFTGYFVNEKTINYITKYMLKIDEKHPKFRGKVLCSAGIGAGYLKREDAKRHIYIPGKTNESYRMRNGVKLNLPIYYKNKLFTEEEREKLFLEKINKGIVYVLGIKIDLKTEESRYMGVLISERERCERLYHDNPKDWDKRKYINRLRKQRKWTESKATIIAEKQKKNEIRSENQFNNDIDLFANIYYNNHSYK